MDGSETGVKQKTKREEMLDSILAWWKELVGRDGEGKKKDKGDTANRAKLRRCATPGAAVLNPQTNRLVNILPNYVSPEAAATIAGILSHIKKSGSGNIAKKLGEVKNGRVVFSETRFRQLLSSSEWDEFYKSLRRAVVMLDGNVSPVSVADMILKWDQEYRGSFKKELSKSLKFVLSQEYYSQSI